MMHGMVVAPQPLAVEEGIRVLQGGGNAIDAAVAAAFVQGSIDPLSCGIGGFGGIYIRTADGEDVFLDFNARAGSRSRPDMWLDEIVGPAVGDGGYLLRNKANDIGYQCIGVPGTVAGLHEAWRRFGTAGWATLLQPAIDHARAGYPIPLELAQRWRRGQDFAGRCGTLERFTWTAAASTIFTKVNGQLLDAGDLLVNNDLAGALERIATEGPEVFYQTSMADQIAGDMEAQGGLITKEDLENYQVFAPEPLRSTYRGYDVVTSPAPYGGITLIQALNILEGFDLGGLGLNTSDYVELIAMAMKAGFADRNRFVGDPLFAAVPSQWLISKERAAWWRDRIERREPFSVEDTLGWESPDTTQLTVTDRHGNCVSLTHTLGVASGVVTPGLGFMYNECMRLFDVIPGRPNAIAPGKARLTAMAQTMVLKEDKPCLILGAPGGNRIIGAVLQTILNVVDHGMSILEAVSAPRVHCQGETIELEGRIPRWTSVELEKRGFSVSRDAASYGTFPARVHAIAVDQYRGVPLAGADPRDYGMGLLESAP